VAIRRDQMWGMRWMVIVLVSWVLGTAAAASDVLGASGAAGEWRALAVVLNAGCVWAALAVVCGWLARGRLTAALAGVVGLTVAVLGYYGYAVLLGDRAELSVWAASGSIRFWLVAAVLLGPGLGLVGSAARRTDLVGVAAAWVLPAGTVTEVALLVRADSYGSGGDPGQAAANLALLVAAGIVASAAVLRWLVVRWLVLRGSRANQRRAAQPSSASATA